MTLADRDGRGSAADRDPVDDGDLADQAKAARVVDAVAARRGRRDRRRGCTAGERQGAEEQEPAGEEDGEGTTHGDHLTCKIDSDCGVDHANPSRNILRGSRPALPAESGWPASSWRKRARPRTEDARRSSSRSSARPRKPEGSDGSTSGAGSRCQDRRATRAVGPSRLDVRRRDRDDWIGAWARGGRGWRPVAPTWLHGTSANLRRPSSTAGPSTRPQQERLASASYCPKLGPTTDGLERRSQRRSSPSVTATAQSPPHSNGGSPGLISTTVS